MDRLSSVFQRLSTVTNHNLKRASTWFSHRFRREAPEVEVSKQVSSRSKKGKGQSSTEPGIKKASSSRKVRTRQKTKDSEKSQPAGADQKKSQPEFAILLIGGGLLVFLGQALTPVVHQSLRWQTFIFSLLGVGFFLLAAQGFMTGSLPRFVSVPLEKAAYWLQVSSAQVLMVALSLLISFAAGLAAGDAAKMKLPEIAIVAWLLAISLIILSNWQSEQKPKAVLWPQIELIAIGGLFLFAFLLRGLGSDKILWFLSGDEGSAGLTAIEFAKGTRNNIFSIGWYSFPSFFFFVQSFSIRLLGQTIIALRVPSALAGALTVIALYWYARKAFGRGIALAAAAYLAGFHYHIHFSRIGLNNIWDGLFIVLFAGALWQAWTGGKRLMYILAGLTLGLAQYFYTSSRGLIILVLVWLAIATILNRKGIRDRLPDLICMFLAAVVIFLPLANFYIHHPDEFLAPHQRVTILGNWLRNEVGRTGDPAWLIVGKTLKESALGFTTRNLRHWYQPDHPMLLPLPASLFLLGVILLLLNLFDLRYLWLALWLLIAILMGGLTESPPAAQRYVFVAPAVSILVALPISMSLEWLSKLWPSRDKVVIGLISLLLIVVIGLDFKFYFNEYAPKNRYGDPNTETATALGFYLAQQEPGIQVYFFGPPRMGYYSLSTITYLAPKAIGQDVVTPITSPPNWSLDGPTLFVFLPERQEELMLVSESYPGGMKFLQRGKDEKLLFVGYYVD
jgi:4-amino-4-deoxy-L-arabinose transferase-like glycosyltransferase